MTIKQQGGIFGRNPTFNDVDVEGTLTVDGLPVTGGNWNNGGSRCKCRCHYWRHN
jgi:hypothetical protein